MPENGPLTVSFVSGKGGVGKTMLAVAFAHEISRSARTLLLDLDFFNRGLTGLMREGTNAQVVTPPDFLKAADMAQAESDSWELVQVASNLFHLRFPDLLPDQIRGLEEPNVNDLADSLKRYIDYLRNVSKCDIIVMDCHGGPDQVSFAACLVSGYSLLISEPDKITFYGTLHFVRQLEKATPATAGKRDLRLVFNKVVPAFSVPYLEKIYNAEVRRYFDDRPLLAVFPLEIYLTKEFERTTFLTAVYPFSQLAKKTQVLIYDLLAGKMPRLAAASTPSRLRLRLWVTRNSLGRIPRMIDLNFVMAVIAAGFLLLTAISLAGSSVGAVQEAHSQIAPVPWYQRVLLAAYEYHYQGYSRSDEIGEKLRLLSAVALAWFLGALILNWSALIDRAFTYYSRIHRRSIAAICFLAALALWYAPAAKLGGFLHSCVYFFRGFLGEWRLYYAWDRVFDSMREEEQTLALASLIVIASAVISQSLKARRNIRFEKKVAEGSVRLLFLFCLTALVLLAWLELVRPV